jgi:hypothetical protein
VDERYAAAAGTPTVEGHGVQCVLRSAQALRPCRGAMSRNRIALNPVSPHAAFRHMSGRRTVAVDASAHAATTSVRTETEESTMSTRLQIHPSRARASRTAAALSIAFAASLLIVTAHAADVSLADAPADATAAKASRPAATTGSRIPDRPLRDLDEVMVIGAVNDPADAQVPEDTSVPALPAASAPRRAEATTGSRIADRRQNDLDEVMVIGAVNDPREADAPEDTALPALPVIDAPVAVRAEF